MCTPPLLPSFEVSRSPSFQPTQSSSLEPSTTLSSSPTANPSTQPSLQPSFKPSFAPSQLPSFEPSVNPSFEPSSQPSLYSTSILSAVPSLEPQSPLPSVISSHSPSFSPSENTHSPSSCVDDPHGWVDIDGDGCDYYAENGRCSKLGDLFTNHGKTANDACCACGGGSFIFSRPSSYPSLEPSTNPSYSLKPTRG